MPKLPVSMTSRAIHMILPQIDPSRPPPEVLVLEIEIRCPWCGMLKWQILGHHLRWLRDVIIATIDEHPGLCGEDGSAQVVERMTLTGPQNEPENN